MTRARLVGSPLILLIASIALPEASLPAQTQTVASSEGTVSGTVSGDYQDTHVSDNVYEAIQETETGGNPSKRRSILEHVWTFNAVPPGASMTFYVEAFHTANSEGDDFSFAISTDGSSYTDILTVTKTSDDHVAQSAALSPGISGTVYIRVQDTDRSQGNRSLDTVFVDHMYIESVSGGPPQSPSDLAARDLSSDSIRLRWTDNASNEDGFRIDRFDGVSIVTAGLVGQDVRQFVDSGLLPSTTYEYVVYAYNSSGDSLPSNASMDTTRAPGSLGVEIVENVWPATNPGFNTYNVSHAYDPVSGHPAIAYVTDTHVRVAQWNGTSWDIEDVVDLDGNSLWGLSLAFSPSGVLGISWMYFHVWELHFAERIGSAWSEELVNTESWEAVDLVYDLTGNPVIAYSASYLSHGTGKPQNVRALKLTRRVGADWVSEVVDQIEDARDQEIVWNLSLAVDPQGNPAVAYHLRLDSSPPEFYFPLKFAQWNGSTWNVETLEIDSSDSPLLAFDPTTGWPTIVHGVNRMFEWNGTGWQFSIVPVDPQYSNRRGLEYDLYGTMHYTDGYGSLHSWDGASWEEEVVWNFSQNHSLAIDPVTQQPSVAFVLSGWIGFARR